MTSSVDDLSANRETDEQQQDSESQIQSPSSANGIPHPYTVEPNMQFLTPQFEAGKTMEQICYPYPDPYYRSVFATSDAQAYQLQPYPAQPMVHFQLMGIQQQASVPLPSETIEEPIFVNAKQYHGILRRRQIRAKAESQKKLAKAQKPYLHESRHQHALRRPRGSGGRFLKSEKTENGQKDGVETQGNGHVGFKKNGCASLENKSCSKAIPSE